MIPDLEEIGDEAWWRVSEDAVNGIEALMAKHHLYPRPAMDLDAGVMESILALQPKRAEANMTVVAGSFPQFGLRDWQAPEGFTACAP